MYGCMYGAVPYGFAGGFAGGVPAGRVLSSVLRVSSCHKCLDSEGCKPSNVMERRKWDHIRNHPLGYPLRSTENCYQTSRDALTRVQAHGPRGTQERSVEIDLWSLLSPYASVHCQWHGYLDAMIISLIPRKSWTVRMLPGTKESQENPI